VSLGLCFNTALFEGKGPVDALTESHRLVWGNWWRTAAILTVGVIIIMVIYLIAGVIIGVLAPIMVFGGGGTENALLISLISSLLIGVLTSLLVTPFYIGLAISIYWDLKLRKDGGDLAARVGALNPA
jgi:ABC-type Fe3+ transport system permease subunit